MIISDFVVKLTKDIPRKLSHVAGRLASRDCLRTRAFMIQLDS